MNTQEKYYLRQSEASEKQDNYKEFVFPLAYEKLHEINQGR